MRKVFHLLFLCLAVSAWAERFHLVLGPVSICLYWSESSSHITEATD